jgi:hypothetical protein
VKRNILVVDAPWDSPNGDLRRALVAAIDSDPRCARIEPSIADRARAEIPGAVSDAFSEMWRATVAGTAEPTDREKVNAALNRWMTATGADSAVALGYSGPAATGTARVITPGETTPAPETPIAPERPLVGYVLTRGDIEARQLHPDDLAKPMQPSGFAELTAAQADRNGLWGQFAMWLGFTLFFPIAFRGPINRVLERESNRANFALLLALGVANLGFALVLSGLSVSFGVIWLLVGSIVVATVWHLTICTAFDKIRD